MSSTDPRPRLELLSRFAVVVGEVEVSLPPSSERAVALLALTRGCVSRSRMASVLWPDHERTRAQANVRSVLWRLPDVVRDTIVRCGRNITMTDRWSVDVWDGRRLARAIIGRQSALPAERASLTKDILPHWDDFWVTLERERYRQLRLHALETLAARMIDDDRPLDAVDIALDAVLAEPLRESAQLLLIRAHLAAGNRAAAMAQFERVRRLLADELGVDPSRELLDLVDPVRR